MRTLAFLSDQFAPALYTLIFPHRALVKFGVHTDTRCTLPSVETAPGTSELALINQISRYDLIICQRITSLPIIKMIKNACHLMDKPLVGVFDDNYIHLERHNPCYFSTSLTGLPNLYRELTNAGRTEEANTLIPQLLADRENGLNELKVSLGLYDMIIVTTEELREAYLPFNKNIKVLQNNIEQVYPERDMAIEQVDENGILKIENQFGLYTVPGFYNNNGKAERVLRMGYSCTPTHYHDFDTTIRQAWTQLTKEYADRVWFTYIGEDPHQPYFSQASYKDSRRLCIPSTQYETYRLNLRNLDIGIAPLAPTPFNMSKSDLKALEYGAWGIPCIAPDYITYSRNWVHGENILLYKNAEEFTKYAKLLLTNEPLRRKLGQNAFKYVSENRQEYQHAEKRYNIYVDLINSKLKFKTIQPKVKTNA